MRALSLGLVLSGLLVLAPLTHAAEWSRYANTRFQYSVSVPPGFSPVSEADDGDGGVSTSPDERSELRVWGGYIPDGDFKTEIAARIDRDRMDGWSISYEQRKTHSASWSGSRGDRILYMRSIAGCDGAAVYFRLEYDRADMKAFDPIVARLVKSLRSAC